MKYSIEIEIIDEINDTIIDTFYYKLNNFTEIRFNEKHGTGVGSYPRCGTVFVITLGPTYLSIPIYYEYEKENISYVNGICDKLYNFFEDTSRKGFETELSLDKLKMKEKIIILKED